MFKTNNQNNSFHKLIELFYQSDCSSFNDCDELRLHYKKIGGLIKSKETNTLKQETRYILYRCVKLLPLEKSELEKVLKFLNNKPEIELSWSVIKKDKATFVLDVLIKDMIQAGVGTSRVGVEFNNVLNGMSDLC